MAVNSRRLADYVAHVEVITDFYYARYVADRNESCGYFFCDNCVDCRGIERISSILELSIYVLKK